MLLAGIKNKMMRLLAKRWLWLFLSFSLLLSSLSAQQKYNIHYTTDDGLPSQTIYSIKEDKLGFIWFSSPMGVTRFDGTHFRTFTFDDGLPDNEVLSIEKDKEGRLWFICFNGRLGFYDYQKFRMIEGQKFTTYPSHFYQDSKDSLHFSNATEHLSLKFETDSRYHFQYYKQKKNTILESEQLRIDTLLSYQQGGYSMHLAPDSILLFQQIEKHWHIVLQTSQDTVHLARIEDAFEPYDLLCNISIYGKEVYVTSNSKGLYHFSWEGRKLKWVETIFSDKGIPTFYKDQWNNKWLGTIRNGLYVLPDDNLGASTFVNLQANEPNNVSAIHKDKEGKLYLGYKNGAIQVISASQPTVFYHNKAPESNRTIKNFFPLGESLLVLSNDPHNQFLHQQKMRELYAPLFFGVQKDMDMVNDTLWVAAIRGVYAYKVENLQEKNPHLSLIYNSPWQERTHAIHISPNRTVWFFHSVKGIGFIRQGQPYFLSEHAGILSSKHKTSLSPADKEIATNYRFVKINSLNDTLILFLSDSRGLAIYNTETQHFLLLKQKTDLSTETNTGLVSNACNSLLVDDNCIWIGTNKGVSVFEYRNNALKHLYNITKRDGLLSNEVNTLYQSGDSIYIGTTHGLNIYNKHKLPLRQENTRLLIDELLIQYPDTNLCYRYPQDLLALTKGYKNLILRCAYLAFGNKEAVELRYNVDDNEWILTSGTDINLTFLSGGYHKIQIQARKGQADWSAIVPYQIYIPLYFYETGWFYSLLTLSLLLLVGYLAKYYIQRERKKLQAQQKMKAHLLSLEMQAAQAMMNPHFLYNIMNSIQYFINSNNLLSANRYLTQFSKLMRLNLRNLKEKYISLSNELDLIEAYLSLEKLRFPEKITFRLDLDLVEKPQDLLIPNMLIQPLVENAIWHGLLLSSDAGELSIHIQEKNEQLIITILDSGIGLNAARTQKVENPSTHKSLGTEMMKQRLEMLTQSTGKRHSLDLKDRSELTPPQKGTQCIVIVPATSQALL